MKRAILAALAVLLFMPSFAYAARQTHKETFTITDKSEIPSEWVDPYEGHHYKLEATVPHGVFNELQTETLSRSVGPITVPIVEVVPAQTAALLERFPECLEVREGGISGEIPLVRVDTAPIYATFKRQVDRVAEQLVSTNDIEELPKEMAFETSSGIQELRRCAVSYEIVERDGTLTQRGEDGLPLTYKATMAFRGIEEYEDITGYTATAQYEGALSGGQLAKEVEATYVYESDETTVPAASGTTTPRVTPDPKPQPPILPIAATATTGVAVFVFCLGMVQNARICVEENGGLRTIGYARIKRRPQGYECVIPSWIDLAKRAHGEREFVIVPGRGIRDKHGDLTVSWRGETLCVGVLSRRVNVSSPIAPADTATQRTLAPNITRLTVGAMVLLVMGAIALGSDLIHF